MPSMFVDGRADTFDEYRKQVYHRTEHSIQKHNTSAVASQQ